MCNMTKEYIFNIEWQFTLKTVVTPFWKKSLMCQRYQCMLGGPGRDSSARAGGQGREFFLARHTFADFSVFTFERGEELENAVLS